MSKRKRGKLNPGVFDPNYSQDPQYGNVSTLEGGDKRIHFHFKGIKKSDQDNKWRRFEITIPDCDIPKQDLRTLDSVRLPVIKEITFQPMDYLSEKDSRVLTGVFEQKYLKYKNFEPWQLVGDYETTPVNLDTTKDTQEIFLLNKPIAICSQYANKYSIQNNIRDRHWLLLQNTLNIFLEYSNPAKSKDFTFSISVYIDYGFETVCVRDALVWRADFEQYTSNFLKYRVKKNNTLNPMNEDCILISRGHMGLFVPVFKTRNEDESLEQLERRSTEEWLEEQKELPPVEGSFNIPFFEDTTDTLVDPKALVLQEAYSKYLSD